MEFFKLPDDPGRLSRAERILRAIEAPACAISLTIHDRQGKLRGPDGAPLLPGRHLHPHECCARGRYQLPHWNTQCVRECLTETESRLARNPVPHLKTCWKTLTELVVPIVRGGVCQLTILPECSARRRRRRRSCRSGSGRDTGPCRRRIRRSSPNWRNCCARQD